MVRKATSHRLIGCVATLVMVFLCSCAKHIVDYIPDSGEKLILIKISTPIPLVINGKVYVHGEDVFNFRQAKIACWVQQGLNVPFKGKTNAYFYAPSGREITVSMPLAYLDAKSIGVLTEFKSTFTQPIFRFVPERDKAYELEFLQFGVNLYSIDDAGSPGAKTKLNIGENLKIGSVTSVNLGEKGREWYIKAN